MLQTHLSRLLHQYKTLIKLNIFVLTQRRKMRKENTAVKSPPVDTSMSIEVGQLQLFVSRLQVQRV